MVDGVKTAAQGGEVIRGPARQFVARLSRLGEAARAAPPEDRAEIERHGREAVLRNARILVLAVGAANILFWPSDLYNLKGLPHALVTYAQGRSVLTAMLLALWLALAWVPFVRRHLLLSLGVAGVAFAFVLGHFFGRIGGPSEPWFHFTYLLMMAPLVCWVDLSQRVVGTVLLGLGAAVGYFAVDPSHLADPLAFVALSQLAFAVGLSIGAGFLLDVLRRESLALRLAVDRQAAQLHALNDGLEGRVREQTAELRFLADRLETARESERTAIARELHDELGQELTALRFALEATTTRFEKDPAALRPNLRQLEQLLVRTTATTRNLLRELRPRVLDELGLVAALEWLVERTGGKVRCRLEAPAEEPSLDPTVAVAAFRIVQESLTNVLRHAEAGEAVVRLAAEGERLVVEVSDDGRGLAPAGEAPRGMGLIGMRERAHALGGTFEVRGRQGQGTTVRVVLPRQLAAREAAS
jgi:signal transduction histidine kinase